jgi:uncharacterized glyoxalase superfamily protein PhnB
MPHIQRCSPVFPVVDPAKLVDHYVRILGFRLIEDALPDYARVTRDDFEIHFHRVPRPDAGEPEEYGYRGGAYLVVDDPDALFAELDARGAKIHYAPEDRPYGMRDFSVADPEGFSLCFGRLIEEPR